MSVDLKIKVTKDILERSKNCSSHSSVAFYNCAIALSIRDIFPDACVKYTRVEYNKASYSILPREASNFIEIFDTTEAEGRPNLPEIEFTITIPDEVIETINIEALRPLLTNHPTLELV